MNIVFLCKQAPMHRDLIERPYGRFYYLPKLLAENGHTISIVYLNYKGSKITESNMNGIRIISVGLLNRLGLGYFLTTRNIVRKLQPDWVIGLSDTYYGILATYLAQKFDCKSLVDAYDNYESYIPWFKPLHWLWRRAIRRATCVTAAGPSLQELMGAYREQNDVSIIPMAADPAFNSDLDKHDCRRNLGLPLNKKIIGYCGAIYKNRGIQLLFEAFDAVHSNNPDILLVLSGRKEKGIRLPKNVIWLGYIDDKLVPQLIRSLDLLMIMNMDSIFGNFSYPVKLYEATQSNVPFLAMKTRSTSWITSNNRDMLYDKTDPQGLAEKMIEALQKGKLLEQSTSWRKSAASLEKILVNGRHITRNELTG